jgi:hypothetical protein
MDNGAILASNAANTNALNVNNVNELNAVENPGESNEDENVRPGEVNLQERETDLVELSRESLNLAGLEQEANPSAGEVLGALETPETLEIETGVAAGIGTEIETNTNQLEEEQTPVNENEAEVNAALTAEAEELAVLENVNTPINVTAQTTEGAVENTAEPVPAPETENLEAETPAPLEEQANQVAQINNILNNNTNQLVVGPVNTETNPTEETSLNQQQILLQNIGSQLAQVIPPASVISVVG